MSLFLNRAAREGEVFIDANQSPAAIRAAMKALGAAHDTRDVCTFSPVVCDCWTYCFRHDGGSLAWAPTVFVWDGERDRHVTDWCDVEYLGHFSLGDLYMRGEFEAPR